MINSDQILINLYAETLPKRNESDIIKCWNVCQLSLGFRQIKIPQSTNLIQTEDIRKDVWFIIVPKQKGTYFRLAYESRIIPSHVLPMILNTQRAKDKLMEIIDREASDLRRPVKRIDRINHALSKNSVLAIGAPLWFTIAKEKEHTEEPCIDQIDSLHRALYVHNYFSKILQDELFKWI